MCHYVQFEFVSTTVGYKGTNYLYSELNIQNVDCQFYYLLENWKLYKKVCPKFL